MSRTRSPCEAILAETSLGDPRADAVDEDARLATSVASEDSAFHRSLALAVAWWAEAEGRASERFDELQRFCETYLKSNFVAETLGLASAEDRPESFDLGARARLG